MLRMLVIFGMRVLELVQGLVRTTVAVCPEELEELAKRTLQSFHYQFPQDLLDLDPAVPVVSTVPESALGSCIPRLYRRRIVNR